MLYLQCLSVFSCDYSMSVQVHDTLGKYLKIEQQEPVLCFTPKTQSLLGDVGDYLLVRLTRNFLGTVFFALLTLRVDTLCTSWFAL